MLQKYFYFQDLIKIKLQKLPRILLLKNSFQDVSLSRNGPDRDSGHFVSFRDCPGQYGTPGHPTSIWFEIWGSWIRVKKISISPGKFPKNFNFFWQFYKRISSFAGKFPKILIFSGN